MKKKEILNLFYNEMNSHFEQWGLKFSKTRLTAKKNQGEITKLIYFDANYFLGKASFQPYLRIRHEEIMKIRGKINPRYDNNHFITVGLHLSSLTDLYNRPDLDYLSEDLGDYDGGSYVYDKTLPFFKENFIEFMESIGNKFFERFYTLNDFDKWFNDGFFDGKYDNKRFNEDRVPIYSVISAYLNNNNSRNEIYEYWIASELYKEAKEEIIEVKEYLEKMNNET